MYDDLEEADSQVGDERPISTNRNHNSHASFSSFRTQINENYFGEADEIRSELATNLALHTIRSSDTRVPDESSSVSNPYESTRGSVTGSSVRSGTNNPSQAGFGYQVQAKKQAFERNRDKRPRTDDYSAPAFNPVAPKKVQLRPIGYHYQKPQNEVGQTRTWDVIDPETQNIIRSRNENRQPSKDPNHPINTPLAGVFGSRNVQVAVEDNTVLTSENLDTLNREQPTTLGRGTIGPPSSNMAWSNEGSAPLGPSSRASLRTIGSSRRPSQNDSVGSSIFETESVNSDRTIRPTSTEIHANIRVNFVTRDEALSHQAPKTNFERTNDDWAASRAASNVIVNKFGDNNIVKMESQLETRIMDWDEHGNYKNDYKGAVKKRIRRGFIEVIQKLEAEMKEASQVYRELLQMRPEERLAALTAMRKPMTQWASGHGASFDDVFETEAIPGIYKKKWDSKKARRDRLDRILQAKAVPKSRANASSQSGRSQQSEAPSTIGGRLGDLDGPLRSTRAHYSVSGTPFSSRNSVADVRSMSARAVSAARSARHVGQKAAGSRSVRSAYSSSTITQQSGGVRPGKHSGITSRPVGFQIEDGTYVYGPSDHGAEHDTPPDPLKLKLNGRGGMPWDKKWDPQADPEPKGAVHFTVPAREAILRRPVPDLELLRKSGMEDGEGSEYIRPSSNLGAGSVGGGSSMGPPPSTIRTTAMRYSVRDGEMLEREDARHERSIMRTTSVNSLGVDRDAGIPRSLAQRVGTTSEGGVTEQSIEEEEPSASYSQRQPAGRQLTFTNVTRLEKETGQSRATSSASKQARNDTASVRTDFAALLEYDDSPLLVEPSDVAFPNQDPIKGDLLKIQEVAMQRSSIRGRAVVVRLHSTVEFTGVAIAKRVFGGIVQEFQLHKDKHSAVVVFVHPAEAHSFLSHYTNVREQGTEQEIRELQIEVAWYNGREQDSIIPPQPNIMTYHVELGATRALRIHNIHPSKLYKDVVSDLNSHFGEKMVMFMTLQAPVENYKLAEDGRQAIVEFACLGDAINAYTDFRSGLMTGYEHARPEFMQERSAKQAQDKPFCNCLGCSERKRAYEEKRARKIMELREQRDNRGSARGTSRSTASRSVTAEPPSVIGSSGARGSTNRSTSGVHGETTDTEGDLVEFSDSEDSDWGF